MPPLPAAGAVLRVGVLFDVGTDSAVRTNLHYKYTGTTPSGATLSTLASQMFSSLTGVLQSLLNTSNSFTGIVLTDLSSIGANEGEFIGSEGGAAAGSPLAASSCAVVSYGIARRYRGGKPRSYWPFGTDEDLGTPQSWVEGFVTAVQSATGTIDGHIAGQTADGTTVVSQVNVSYYEGFTVITNPITHRSRNVPTLRGTPVVDDITSRQMRSRIGSQRKRLGKS